jgi:pilus assembly protein CpaE
MADPIKILLVDDIAEVRENTRKLLAFEQDFEVVGSSGSRMDGIRQAKELEPDIIIMDINMPDIDGISATQQVKQVLPATGVIMMSVNSDRDYLRRAMNAGASDFLTKPPNMEDLYSTIRSVYKLMEPQRQTQKMLSEGAFTPQKTEETEGGGDRAGHIVVAFSPKGGVGTTTIATNLASALMSANTKVLLIDADIQFGDINTFLNLKPQSTLADIVENAEDLDVDYFENIVVTHPSGIKVLLGPERPEFAERVYALPGALAEIIRKIRYHYDFVVIDTASRLDEITVGLCDLATILLMVCTPTLPAIRGVHLALNLFDKLYENDLNKIKIVLSKVSEERRGSKLTINSDKIASYLKREIYAAIPSDEKAILQAINKGIPAIAAERNTDRPPVRELLELAQRVRTELVGEQQGQGAADPNGRSGSSGLFGGLNLGR